MQGRNEAILRAIIDGTGTSGLEPPQSRIEALLYELMDKIDQGGGGGGGSGGGGLVVTATEEGGSFVLDKTWKEIHDAIASGQNVSILLSADFGQYAMTVTTCLYAEGEQKPYIIVPGDSSFEFTAALQTDYPST